MKFYKIKIIVFAVILIFINGKLYSQSTDKEIVKITRINVLNPGYEIEIPIFNNSVLSTNTLIIS